MTVYGCVKTNSIEGMKLRKSCSEMRISMVTKTKSEPFQDILSKSEIESNLEIGKFIKEVVFFDETDSTNIRAKVLGEEGKPEGTLVVAESQSTGKGRRGRSFESPEGKSIYMTILLRPDMSPAKASMVTIIAAMAVRKALEEECSVKAGIKWPNDIVADGRKLCGILTEMSAEPDKINYIAVGIGINVNNDSMPEIIKEVAVSLKMLTGTEQKRSRIIASVIKCFEIYYSDFLKEKNLSFVQKEYNKYLIHMEKEIEILKGNERCKAKSLGIADDGELIVEMNGRTQTVMSGEVSVRGVYGYV